MNLPNTSQSSQASESHAPLKPPETASGLPRLPETASGLPRLVEVIAQVAPAMLLGGVAGTLLAVLLGNLKSSSLPGLGALGGVGLALLVRFIKSFWLAHKQ